MKKYKVTQEFMNELIKWRDEYTRDCFGVDAHALDYMPKVVDNWRFNELSSYESNRRFGAIINWINGEDVFEIGKQEYIVQRKVFNLFIGRQYISRGDYGEVRITRIKEDATRFDDFNKASGWANNYFEVVEVDE